MNDLAEIASDALRQLRDALLAYPRGRRDDLRELELKIRDIDRLLDVVGRVTPDLSAPPAH